MKKILQIGAFVMMMALSPQTRAAEYADQGLGLSFEYPDGLQVVDNQQIMPGFRLLDSNSQDIRYEIAYRMESLSEILQDVQLRVINTQTRTNIELLGQSAIELVGSTFDTNEPLKVILVPHREGNLQIASFGNSLTAYQNFLRGMRKPRIFQDTTGHALLDEMEQSYDAGIFSGYERGDGTREFRPDDQITRAAFMKVIVLSAEGVTQEKVDNEYARRMVGQIFSDVEDDAWFAPYIYYAADQGWVSGYADQTFKPASPINAAEASKIILKSRGISTSGDEEVWYRPFFTYWANSNILVGNDDLYRFSFDDQPFLTYEPMKRSHVAGLLMRLNLLQTSGDVVFGREKSPESLDFNFGSEVDRILELGKPARSIGAEMLYALFRDEERIGNVVVFEVPEWIARETREDPLIKGLEYLGENTQQVYAFRPLCGSETCATKTIEPFMLVDQDLFLLGDENLSFRVLSPVEMISSLRIDQDLETLTVSDSNGNEVVLMSYFSRRGNEADRYNDQLPLRRVTMGGKSWNVYEGDRVTLTTALGDDLMVYTLRTIDGFDEVSDAVKVMMRTLHRN